MIATSDTALIENAAAIDQYDDFLFGSKEKRAKRKQKRIERRNSPKRVARRKKRKEFFKKLGDAYRDIGGATAIGGAIDTITGMNPPITPNPENNTRDTTFAQDYSIGIATPQTRDKPKEKSNTPMLLFVVGGIFIIGITGVLLVHYNKK